MAAEQQQDPPVDTSTMFLTMPSQQTPAQAKQAEPPPPQQPSASPATASPAQPAATPPAASGQPPAAAAQTPSGQSQPPAADVNDALAIARELGIDTRSFPDARSLVTAMYSAVGTLREQSQEASRFADLGRQIAPVYDKFQAFLASQSQAQPPAQAAESPPAQAQGQEASNEFDLDGHFAKLWTVPEWKPEWDRAVKHHVVVQGEDGAWRPADGFEFQFGTIAQEMNLAQQARSSAGQEFFQNPLRRTYDGILDPMRHEWQHDIAAAVQDAFRTYVTEQKIATWEDQFAPFIVERDPITGAERRTAWGDKFLGTINELRQGGMTDEDRIMSMAYRFAGPPPGQGAGAPAQPAAGGAAPASLAGPAALSEQKKQDFLTDSIRRTAQTTGGYSERTLTDSAPPSTEAELNNFFVNDFARRKGANQ